VRPYTVVFSTMTVDGRIASGWGESLLSCREDFVFQHRLRASVDLVLVGSETAVRDNPRLTVRLVEGVDPLRGTVDSRLRVPPSARMFDGGQGVLVTVEGHPEERLAPYRERGVRVVQAGRGRVDLPLAWERLARELGVRRVMVEGGGRLNGALFAAGLVDELIVTVAPYAYGSGVSLLEADLAGRRGVLVLERVERVCGGWARLYYRVARPKRPLY